MPTFEESFMNFKPPSLPENLRLFPDRVSQAYANKTLFITGGTGFLGKVLLEKLLRKSPDIKKIYLLLRTKKGIDATQRVKDLFSTVIFDYVKELRGTDFLNKVIPISGDVSELNLGISDDDRQILTNEVNIVFHVAASVRFDETLKRAVLLNTRGTKMMLELAKAMNNLKCFVHVSTAYCHPNEKVLHEKSYPPPIDPHKVIKSMEILDDKTTEVISKQILGTFPNTYAFTKCLSEDLVFKQMESGLPCLILRPSIIIPIWKEPLPGWNDNINGPTGILIGAGKGVIRTMYCNNTGYADFMPVDIAINGILLFTWNYLENKDITRNIGHLTSSQEWQVTWQEIIDIGKNIATNDVPFNKCIWYPGGSIKQSKLFHYICVFFFHTIPAYFLDALIYLSGNTPCLVGIQGRINKGFEVFEYYTNNQWEFRNEHIHHLRKIMNAREKFEYTLDGDEMDLKRYFMNCAMGARVYILKEMPDTLPRARVYIRMLYYVDIIAKLLFFGSILMLLFNWSDSILVSCSKITEGIKIFCDCVLSFFT
ncbi:putative fatty acyl-CoA reductase CG5065 [Daktulosphaira vitifoliae]|uniref:putative fatty acyl-CoA reductase CG5065 n=1 Tax=Daktulosphaira vitifoliae TaxID=58002 RepID=UPI0021A9DE5D|nr:putative fatty acyl-CoA reductase CG5065 [Daktulosphaira vitifoliae]